MLYKLPLQWPLRNNPIPGFFLVGRLRFDRLGPHVAWIVLGKTMTND